MNPKSIKPLYSLEVLSPKLAAVLKNINTTLGLIFAYSQFRNAEGIEIMRNWILMNPSDGNQEEAEQWIEILEGLTANDKIVKEGLSRLADGMTVRPLIK